MTEGQTLKEPGEKIAPLVLGISGISESNFREGYNPRSRVFDKSRTRMRERGYLNYCRIGDPDQIRLLINEGKVARPRRSSSSGKLEVAVDGTNVVWTLDSASSLLSATGYSLFARDRSKKGGETSRPLLMVFRIGRHRVKSLKYEKDRPAIDHGDLKFCSDSDYSTSLGYHLEPGVVKVDKVLELVELDVDPNVTYAQPFKLVDVTHEFE